MVGRFVLLVVVGALAASAVAGAAGTSKKVRLTFPKACTGAVYTIGVKPTGKVSAVTVRNAAAGLALPASIRAVAAITTRGTTVTIFVFMNNLAPRQLSAAREDALELLVGAAAIQYTKHHTDPKEQMAVTDATITTNDLMSKVTSWVLLGKFPSPAPSVARYSAAPASDRSAHCG